MSNLIQNAYAEYEAITLDADASELVRANLRETFFDGAFSAASIFAIAIHQEIHGEPGLIRKTLESMYEEYAAFMEATK